LDVALLRCVQIPARGAPQSRRLAHLVRLVAGRLDFQFEAAGFQTADAVVIEEFPNMAVTDELLRNNETYARSFTKGDLPLPPAKHVAVLACMDARLDVHNILGLQEGEAHVIRNAGGVATDDAIRSLVISQRLLGTNEIILIHHTDCGMLTFKDDDVKGKIESEVGIRPAFALEAFGDLEADVKQSIARIEASPFIPNKSSVRGFVYDVRSGRLNEVRAKAGVR
jgi:carbonic anhydrase